MRILPYALTAIAVGMISFSTPAHACTTSTWSKLSGNSLASTIRGRDCSGTMSVRLIGIIGDTGWLPMYKNGSSNFTAQYGDGTVLTDIKMVTNGATMNVNFVHKAATGQTYTQGAYHLTGN